VTLGTSILVVDDDSDIRKVLAWVLSRQGYLVETVENGKQALKVCEKLPFDVALIDIELPDMKGTELLAKLKALQPEIIRIIVTGFPSVENAMKTVNEGAEGYVLKPFNAEELLAMIRKHLEEKANEHLRLLTEKTQIEQEQSRFNKQFKKSGSIFST
jgi:DNA-binding NtrC family response regulator